MTIGPRIARLNSATGGLAVDLPLYAVSTVFALITALTSTLLPHRAWGSIAVWFYGAGFCLALTQYAIYRARFGTSPASPSLRGLAGFVGDRGRIALAWVVGAGAALVPMVVQTVQRAGGRTDRAQEEVLVVEHMGERLLHDGTPYLTRDAIAALPVDERLMAYSPYQPGMSIFGLPRAMAGDAWWTDSRIWFAVATVAALIVAARLLATGPAKVRALHAVTVFPICALTLATGGDDIPVLALCLLALALAATNRYGWAGVAVGAATACKLFALPVVAVLIVLALATRNARRLLPGAIGLPLVVLIPPFLVNADGFLENVLRFPLGHALVTSPAQSPFPGYLIAQNVPGGRLIAAVLLVAVAAFITVRMVRRPPRDATTAAVIIGLGLLAAILLMPTTRFGYLLYPVAFLLWAPALGMIATPAHRNHTATVGPDGDTALYRR